ncbi:MAG: putative sulfate exporter family transporter [Eubacteriales bacterium]|nr:putative sulfate exporter family transporter [Eubacteriales bacterium]
MFIKVLKSKSFYLAFICTLVASLLGFYLKNFKGLELIGALVLALLIGMLMQLIPGLKRECHSGVGFISNKFLRLGIILLGFKLNLKTLASHGPKMLLLALVVVFVTIVLDYIILQKIFGNAKKLSLLTSAGCGICGAAAIMGVSPSLDADQDDTVLAVAVICIMGTIFTLIEVGLLNAGYLAMTPQQYGVLAGSSLHEIAHAVAAGNAGGAAAEEIAVLAKLSRVLMLVPVAFLFGFLGQKFVPQNKTERTQHKLPIPWFMLGFLASSIIGSYFEALQTILPQLVQIAYIVLGMAMAALGINVNFRVIRERGGKLMLASFIGSCLQLGGCYLLASKFF